MKLKIGFLPLYRIEYPSSRYRVFQFLEPLVQRGFKCTLLEAPQGSFSQRLIYLPRLYHLARSHDLLVVQKRLFPEVVLRFVRQFNSHILFDLDDAIFLHVDYRPRVDATLRAATIVVAGNEYLASYARKFNQHVEVIPTVVDTNLYLPRSGARHPDDGRVIVGWIGGDPNRGDFTSMKPVLDWLGERYVDQVVLRIIGSRPLEMETALELEFIHWTLETSRSQLQTFDIGIMPLEDTDWNRGKCGLKLIQYMAVGAAVVASPVGVNHEIVLDKETGYLAQATEQWTDSLASLVEDRTLRLRMGHSGRDRVERCYSLKAVLPTLTDVLRHGASANQKEGA